MVSIFNVIAFIFMLMSFFFSPAGKAASLFSSSCRSAGMSGLMLPDVSFRHPILRCLNWISVSPVILLIYDCQVSLPYTDGWLGGGAHVRRKQEGRPTRLRHSLRSRLDGFCFPSLLLALHKGVVIIFFSQFVFMLLTSQINFF